MSHGRSPDRQRVPVPDNGREGFRPDIEGLRGLAVASVVLFHAGLLGHTGFVGVDVFYVISGFLITGMLLRERRRSGGIRFLDFYARRFRRLAPAAALVLLVVMAASTVLINPLDRNSVMLDGATSALSIGNFRFALAEGDYFNAVHSPSPFLHFWSLAVEDQFYLIWPALLFLVGRGRRPDRAVGIALVAVAVGSLLASVLVTAWMSTWAYYSLPTRAWELAIGGVLAVAAGNIRQLPRAAMDAIGWAGLAAILAATFLISDSVPYPGIAALAPVLGSAALVASGMQAAGPYRLFVLQPLRLLGRISYSLYLWHWPILVFAPIITGDTIGPRAGLALSGLSVVLAYVSWRFVEEPFHHGMNWLSGRPGRTSMAGLAALLAIAVIGTGLAWQADSWMPANGDAILASTVVIAPSPGASASVSEASATVYYALPPDLRPPVGAARTDSTESELRADNCIVDDLTTAVPDCVYGDVNGKTTIALVGDSHAAEWFPGLLEIARHRGWRIVTYLKVECAFIDLRLFSERYRREYTECGLFMRSALARIVALKPDLTIVTQSRKAIVALTPSQGTPENEAAAEARMVAQLPGRVAIIVDTPLAGQDVPACIAWHPGDVRPCQTPRSTAFKDALGVRERAVAQSTGATLLDFTYDVCVTDPCPVIVNKVLLYRDDGHLTRTFMATLTPKLEAAIAPLTQSP